MRLAFMGSPDFAAAALRALSEAGHEIAAVYAQPPKPAGRGQKPRPCAVHALALDLGLPVRTPDRLRQNPAEQEYFAGLRLDAAVVAAYGLILPPGILAAPRRGCLNIHASLLPRWRGAAPIQAAILAGDRETGITIMQMDEGLDTGALLRAEPTPIGPRDTAASLHDRLAAIGARLIVEVLAHPPEPVPQDEVLATYAPKLRKADARLDFSKPALRLERQVRAYQPWPGSLVHLGGQPVKVLAAEVVAAQGIPGTVLDDALTIACGRDALRLTRLQRPGRSALAGDAFLRGFPVPPGSLAG